MYKWMDWIISPDVNAHVAVWFGEAPSNSKACAIADQLEADHCATFHANDESYFDKVYEWVIPQAELRRLARRRLQGLRGLAPGLDGGEGLTGPMSSAGARRRTPAGLTSDDDQQRRRSAQALGRRLATALYRRPRLQLGLLLAPPMGALVSPISGPWCCCW